MLTEEGLGAGELWGGLDTRAYRIKGGPGIGISCCPYIGICLFWILGPSLLYSMYMYVMYVCVLFQQLGKGPIGFSPHPLRNGRVGDVLCFSGPSCIPHEQSPMKLQPCMHLHESSLGSCFEMLQLCVQLHEPLRNALLHHLLCF